MKLSEVLKTVEEEIRLVVDAYSSRGNCLGNLKDMGTISKECYPNVLRNLEVKKIGTDSYDGMLIIRVAKVL